MFDIGFSEILLISVLSLVVLGPEKLPKVVSQVGRLVGRARGMARQFREQLEEEVNLEEARRAQPPAYRAPSPPPPPATPPPESLEPTVGTSGPIEGASASNPAAPHDVQVDAGSSGASGGGPTAAVPPSPEPEQPRYPDTYSHAHATDSLGRDVSVATTPGATAPEAPAPAVTQQDWVGGVTGTEKSSQPGNDAGYAPPHERGT
jgi:sec-independent protein translocase protein TatB